MFSKLFQRADRSYFNATHKLTDEQHYEMIIDSLQNPVINGLKMPGFPIDNIQKQFVGATQQAALLEAYNFYKVVKLYCQTLDNPIRPNTRIVDFGCGWGRIIRFFFKDIYPENIHGVDVDPEMISFCSDAMQVGSYGIVDSVPPTKFKDNSIDVIFAYSVFSHLAPSVAVKWVQEFSRILRPNGLILITTQARYFLDYVESLKGKELDFAWHKGIVNALDPIDETRRRYDNGEFIYVPTGGGGVRSSDYYGEALIPRKFVEEEFSKYLKFRYFLMDHSLLAQTLIIMQKER